MAEYGQNNVFNLLEVEPSLEDQVDEKPAGKEKKNVKKENKAPSKKAPASEAPVAAAPAAKAPRKRDHDRHVSGTGRGKETQKGGAGKHNWGDKDTTPETAAVDATEAHTDAPAADDAAAEEDKQPTLGLDDYFKQLQAKRPEEDNQQNVREVVEDDSFKVIRSLDKDEDDDILFGDVMIRKELKKKGGAGGKKKASVSLDEFVKEHGGLQRERDFDRSRGDRGGRGRGGFRGGRGRGGFGSPAGLAPVGGDAAVDAAAAPVAAPVAGDAAPAAVAAPAAASPAAGAGAGAAPAAGAERGGFRGRGRGGRGRGGDFERGRGRGGRGGGDFRGGRGGPRGGHPGSGPRRDVNANQASIDIANDESFPALGAPRK